MAFKLHPPAGLISFSQEINSGAWLAQGPSGERLIARQFRDFSRVPDEDDEHLNEIEARHRLFSDPGVMSSIWQIFNHENIVSLAGFISHPFAVAQDDPGRDDEPWAIWDFCDAGNLELLFETSPPQAGNTQYYLPESLCWHVLRSLLRAVVFLHDGKRRTFDQAGKLRAWASLDEDWNPILHRAILPRNICFQHPRGSETYGPCKLAGFWDATLTNHVLDLTEDGWRNKSSFALTSRRGWVQMDRIAKESSRQTLQASRWHVPYSLAEEILSIADIVFKMMTGQDAVHSCPLQYSHVERCSEGGCLFNAAGQMNCECVEGGCGHVPAGDCSHTASPRALCDQDDCGEPFVNVDSDLARARYSWWLRVKIRQMMDLEGWVLSDAHAVVSAAELADEVEQAYRQWREGAPEGQAYRDVDDEVEDSRKESSTNQTGRPC